MGTRGINSNTAITKDNYGEYAGVAGVTSVDDGISTITFTYK
jgi:hypothetical protein